ncbi:MAG: hypothetical protein HOI53_00865 [Francisellaceae bacterium]|jgi:hypothetical protein|nr:hypothetical protein [Francisellaceae bacterium]MBT6206551.1 hypothetical protein [Francisellaceae bacterium]
MRVSIKFILLIMVFFAPITNAACTASALASAGIGALCCDNPSVNAGGPIGCFNEANMYEFRIMKFCFYDSNNNESCFGSPNNFDGASVGVGVALGSFISSNLSVGTYVKTKAHVDKRFRIQSAGFASGGGGGGSVACAAKNTAFNTNRVGYQDMQTTMNNVDPGSIPNCTPGGNEQTCLDMNDPNILVMTDPTNFTLKEGQSLDIQFQFDASTGVAYTVTGGGACVESGNGMGPMLVNMLFTVT